MNSLDKKAAANLGKDIASSLRPRTIILSWAVYSGVIIIHRGIDIPLISLGLLLFIAMYGVVALQNDLSDVETDKMNQRQDVPYALGRLTVRHLIKTMFALSIFVTLVGLILGYKVLPWVGLYIALGYAYSGPLNIKSRGIFAALLLGFCYGAMPWLIAASLIDQLSSVHLITTAFISFVFSSGIIVIKDFKDIKGDRATNKQTLLVRKGPEYTRTYFLVTTSIAYLLAIVYFYQINHTPWFILIGIAVATINYVLLATESILIASKSRSIRGNWSRLLFFAYTPTAYFTSISMN